MLKNYWKVALRYLVRYKGYTAINILGLSVGIACCFLIMLFVRSELSYDRWHAKADRIYRAWVDEKDEGKDFINTVTPIPLGPALQANLPQVESTCRVFNFNSLVKYAGAGFSESVHMADFSLFSIFGFRLKEGDPKKPFPNDNSIILSEPVARKYFGQIDPLGKTLELQLGSDTLLFTVSGVVADYPAESSIRFGLLIPFTNDHYFWNERVRTKAWSQVFAETYILLRKGQTGASAEGQLPAMVRNVLGTRYKPGAYNVHLQPLTAIHLDTSLPAGIEPISNPKYAYILSTIGFLILLLACINFITLSIGRSATRAMEVGVRKVLGAERQQLLRQFWGEAFLLTLVSLMTGLALTFLLLSPFNRLTDKALTLSLDGFTIAWCLLLVILIAFIAGIYPAIILSGFNPVEVLKGKFRIGNSAGLLRKTLVAAQFVASIALIVSTLVIHQQLDFLRDKDLGYKKDQVVIVPTNRPRMEGKRLAELYRTELLRLPDVENASTALFSFAETPWMDIGYNGNDQQYRNFEFNAVDAAFLPTMNIQLAAGRNFLAGNSADISSSILVNETLVKQYGWKDPIGQRLPGAFNQRIIGVMKDFAVESLHTKIRPLVLALIPDSILNKANDVNFAFAPQPRVSVRLRAGDLARQIDVLKAAWHSVAPGQDFEYNFLDQTIARQYAQDQRTGTIVQLASALAIFIACMGLFGLATLTVARRTREIGIRKILGAGIPGIVGLLSMEFMKLVLIAAGIAIPLGWWAMHNWLQDFAYQVPIRGWIFLVATILALSITLLTVGLQALRAALANPVKSLRTE
jgi:putative ABC transport system permease protein